MNTSKEYLKEIRYRKARCCFNCKHYKGIDINYCWLHDNVVKQTNICKDFKIKEQYGFINKSNN